MAQRQVLGTQDCLVHFFSMCLSEPIRCSSKHLLDYFCIQVTMQGIVGIYKEMQHNVLTEVSLTNRGPWGVSGEKKHIY